MNLSCRIFTALGKRDLNHRCLLCMLFFFCIPGWSKAIATSTATPPSQSLQIHLPRDEPSLKYFISLYPKGADLHSHLTGAAYAETVLQVGHADPDCINRALADVPNSKPCLKDHQLATINQHPQLRKRIIDAWSMQDFSAPNDPKAGHDHFFKTFAKFFRIVRHHRAKVLAHIMQRAARERVQYLEIMSSDLWLTLPVTLPKPLQQAIAQQPDQRALSRLRKQAFYQEALKQSSQEYAQLVKEARQQLDCAHHTNEPGCQLTVKFLMAPMRAYPFEQVFVQMALAFELTQRLSQHIVGVNFVAPEDHPIALRDYQRHMQLFRFFHQLYPDVPISLHAGELTQAFVPDLAARQHIRQAVLIGQAKRIGHGVDIRQEKQSEETLRYLRKHHILIEINLSSNEEILHVQGSKHPLPLYLNAHVPVALSTDDEGVLRTNLNHEYYLAIQRYHLRYQQLKEINRNSLSYSFLPGKSLWLDHQSGTPVPACQKQTLGTTSMTKACQTFLAANQKAKLQWKLEGLLASFEQKWLTRTNKAG